MKIYKVPFFSCNNSIIMYSLYWNFIMIIFLVLKRKITSSLFYLIREIIFQDLQIVFRLKNRYKLGFIIWQYFSTLYINFLWFSDVDEDESVTEKNASFKSVYPIVRQKNNINLPLKWFYNLTDWFFASFRAMFKYKYGSHFFVLNLVMRE